MRCFHNASGSARALGRSVGKYARSSVPTLFRRMGGPCAKDRFQEAKEDCCQAKPDGLYGAVPADG